jgi:hypothetical protein
MKRTRYRLLLLLTLPGFARILADYFYSEPQCEHRWYTIEAELGASLILILLSITVFTAFWSAIKRCNFWIPMFFLSFFISLVVYRSSVPLVFHCEKEAQELGYAPHVYKRRPIIEHMLGETSQK